MSKDLNSYIVWTAIITPMHDDGSVDFDSFKNLLKEQEAAGNGIVVLGSTGESLNMSDEDRRQVATFVSEQGLDVPLICGLGGSELEKQQDWVRFLDTLNYDGYLLAVPMYAKPGSHGQYNWFKSIMDVTDRPFMIYNVPGRTCKDLDLDALKRLAKHPNFWAIKEASASVDDFKAISDAAPNAHMMSGDDPMLPAFAKLGAKGVVSVAANIWPEAAHEYARQCVSGEFNDEELWAEASKSLFCASNPIPAKALLHDLGRIESPQVRLPLSTEDMPDIDIVRKTNQKIEAWLTVQKS